MSKSVSMGRKLRMFTEVRLEILQSKVTRVNISGYYSTLPLSEAKHVANANVSIYISKEANRMIRTS